MNELAEEVRAYEALNHISEELDEKLDAEGAQDNADVLDESMEECPRLDFLRQLHKKNNWALPKVSNRP